MKAKVSEQEFIRLWRELKNPSLVAKAIKIDVRNVMSRRRAIEARLGISLGTEVDLSSRRKVADDQLDIKLRDGVVIVFSDAHYWPGMVSTAHKALLHFCRVLRPAVVINNGDSLDGASISRFPRDGWERPPAMAEEMQAVADRLAEIKKAARGAQRVWNKGNHCNRFEMRLAQAAGEFDGVSGFTLREHYPDWQIVSLTWINEDTIIKHAYKGGIHAAHNNTVNAGVNIVTGHLHQLKVSPFSDYRGRRYGVDTGMLADLYGPQFRYVGGNPQNWGSGFAVLTFRDGKLMPPELVEVIAEGKAAFRGEVVSLT